jgi:hypothetical protein
LGRTEISTRLQSGLEKRSISPMTPAPRKVKITDGALRAAKQIERDASFVESTAEIIDRETGVREVVEYWKTSSPKPAILSRAAARNSSLKRAPPFGATGIKHQGRPNDRSPMDTLRRNRKPSIKFLLNGRITPSLFSI